MPRPLSTPPHYSLPYLPSNPKARTPRMLSPHTFFGGIQHCSLQCGLGISVCVCVCVCVCVFCVCVCVCVCVCWWWWWWCMAGAGFMAMHCVKQSSGTGPMIFVDGCRLAKVFH